MKHSIAARTALCLLVPALLGTSSSVLAASDYKSFSTNTCVPLGAAASNDLTYSSLGLLNTSTTESRVVICPLVKDAEGEWTASTASLHINYKAPGGSSGTVNCTIYVGSITSGSWSATSSEPVTPAGQQGSISFSPQTTATWIYEPVNLACALGPRMRLTRVYLRETGTTNTP